MDKLVAGFSKQLADAIRIGESISLPVASSRLDTILICGLGGSGIGGTIVSQMVEAECKVPVHVSKDYDVPAFAGKNTLAIISSYSGNTEETLACLAAVSERQCQVVCITSGGKVAEIARQKKSGLILLPGGMPPRSCLGYSFTQLFFILSHYGFLSPDFKKDLQSAIALIDGKENEIITEAEKVSSLLVSRYPIIYCTSHWEGVAIRFRQQLNENAKTLCSHHVIPEMNHNELVGWRTYNAHTLVLLFRDRDENKRNDLRIQIIKEVIAACTPHIVEIWSEGKTKIEKAIWFIHIGDWISVKLAEKRGVDPVEVKVIDHLKSELGKK